MAVGCYNGFSSVSRDAEQRGKVHDVEGAAQLQRLKSAARKQQILPFCESHDGSDRREEIALGCRVVAEGRRVEHLEADAPGDGGAHEGGRETVGQSLGARDGEDDEVDVEVGAGQQKGVGIGGFKGDDVKQAVVRDSIERGGVRGVEPLVGDSRILLEGTVVKAPHVGQPQDLVGCDGGC